MLFGLNDKAGFLFKLLNLSPEDFGRYRDVYVTGEHIVVHTRNGGGNREFYEDVFDAMSTHSLYDYDKDSDFDCTYADIYFRHPEKYSELLKEMATNTVTPNEKWKTLLEVMNS